MSKILTLALASTLATAALSASAQVKLDGVISASEIGGTTGLYQSLGKFTTPHDPGKGFGNAGLLQLYGAATASNLYVGIAGTIEVGGNDFQLYMDLPNKSGVPVGTGLPNIAGSGTVFGTFKNGGIGGTKLELEADAAIATTGQGDVQAAIYTATTGEAKSLGGGAAITNDGTSNQLYDTDGDYAIFNNAMVAYKQPNAKDANGNVDAGLSGNPGSANDGGPGSYALEYQFDSKALGLPSGAGIVHLFVAYVSGDAYWSSDFIPESVGNGKDSGGLNNVGYSPDFTDQTRFPGTQAATLNLVVLSTKHADDAVVAMSVFPNPSAGTSTVSYQVRDASQAVSVRVLDLLGRPVSTLLNAKQAPGFHDLRIGTGDLAAGTYLVNVQVGDKVATRRLTVTN